MEIVSVYGNPDSDSKWVWNEAIALDEPMLIHAASGVGKSLFTLGMVLSAVRKEDFLGWKHSLSDFKALWLDGELSVRECNYRFDLYNARTDDRLRDRFDYVFMESWLDDPLKLTTLAKDGGYNLVVLDSIRRLIPVDDENASASFKDLGDLVVSLKKAGIWVVVIHHSNKNKRTYAGSSNIETTFASIINLMGNPKDLELNVDKSRTPRINEWEGRRCFLSNTGIWQWEAANQVCDEHLYAALEFIELVNANAFRNKTAWADWTQQSWFGNRFGEKTDRLWKAVFDEKVPIPDVATEDEFSKWLTASTAQFRKLETDKRLGKPDPLAVQPMDDIETHFKSLTTPLQASTGQSCCPKIA